MTRSRLEEDTVKALEVLDEVLPKATQMGHTVSWRGFLVSVGTFDPGGPGPDEGGEVQDFAVVSVEDLEEAGEVPLVSLLWAPTEDGEAVPSWVSDLLLKHNYDEISEAAWEHLSESEADKHDPMHRADEAYDDMRDKEMGL